MPTCPIHHVPLKPRIPHLDVDRPSSHGRSTEEEWNKYIDEKHQSAAETSPTYVMWVCPKCSYAVGKDSGTK